jgi:translation initiation factor 1
MKNRRNLVFSTNKDWQPEEQEEAQRVSNKQGTLYLLRDRKGRGGKTVTVIEGYKGDSKAMLKRMQKLCGSGGSIKSGNLEIQGDHRNKIAEFLKDDGFNVKLKGG